MKSVIIAGGAGTRLGKMSKEIPKPMLEVGGKPILEHQIENLKRCGFKDIIICTGHMSHKIEEYFLDGKGIDVEIKYSVEKRPLGSGGCLKMLEDELLDPFIALNGDLMIDMDFRRLVKFHKEKKSDATLVVHPNDHPMDSDLVGMDSKQGINAFYAKPHPEGFEYDNLVNAGVYVLTEKVLKHIPPDKKTNLDRFVFPRMISHGLRLYGYNTPEYILDMGTPQRLSQVRRDYISGKVKKQSFENKRPAFFLDRDGVINDECHLLCDIDDFKLIEGVPQAIKMINRSGYLAIVVTNQPVVARGLCTVDDVAMIHRRMQTQLGNEGAMLDAIYFCPHHPDKGYPGENPEYKILCDCRKPSKGMLYEAAKRFNIDLSKSYMVGDSTVDIVCGKNANVKTVGVRTGNGLKDGKFDISPDHMFDDLYHAVKSLLDV